MNMSVVPGNLLETDISLLGQGSRLSGNLVFDNFTRIHGEIEGKVIGVAGSLIVIGETGAIYGEIECNELIVDGFVHGNIFASGKVTISESGKLLGNIIAPKIEIRFGAHFEGKAITNSTVKPPKPTPKTKKPSGLTTNPHFV